MSFSTGPVGSGFDASGARLYAAHLRIAAALDEARQAVAAITAQAPEVLDGWVGPAGAAYAAGFRRWRDGAQLILEALAESGAGLEHAARDYDAAEAVSRAAIVGSAR
jgi:WXG100 family type VII secretion target